MYNIELFCLNVNSIFIRNFKVESIFREEVKDFFNWVFLESNIDCK